MSEAIEGEIITTGGRSPERPKPVFDQSQARKAVVKMSDGSSWLCEIDSTGRLVPVRIVREAPPPPEPEPKVSPITGMPEDYEDEEHDEEEAEPGMTGSPMPGGAMGGMFVPKHGAIGAPFKGSGTIPKSEAQVLEDDDNPSMEREAEHQRQYLEHEEHAKARYTPEEMLERMGITDVDSTKAVTMKDNVFQARLSSVMTDNMYDRIVSRKKKGKLDMKHLWKAHVGAKNLFMKKEARKNKEYNVVLVVDESGSMHGSKIRQAADIAVFLAKAFEGININLAIVGFNAFVMIHKDFDEKIDFKVLHKIIQHNAGNRGASHNNDFDALSRAYKLLAGRKGKNFVIFLSDGAPASTTGTIERVLKDPMRVERGIANGEAWASYVDISGRQHKFWTDTESKVSARDRDTKKELNHLVLSNKELADTIGIGIRTDCWQCPVNFREDSLDKLKPLILGEIRKKITRG